MNEEGLRLLRRSALRVRRSAAWLRTEEVPPAQGDFLRFLGTGGNPSGVIGQRRRTGGIWLSLGGKRIALDPGPGAAFHAARSGLDARGLDAVLISHGHTDHYMDAPALIEGMCRGMSRRGGLLCLPREALALGLIGRYHLGLDPVPWYPGGPVVTPWEDGREVALGPVTLTPFRVHHGPENYGITFAYAGRRIVYSSDTSYVLLYEDEFGKSLAPRPGEPLPAPRAITQVREDVLAPFFGADLAILNVSFFWQHAHRHLTAMGAADLLRRAGVRKAIITHFDRSAAPDAAAIARYVAQESGADVVAARDGMQLPFGT
ncbi:MAG: MBL fold metallo-hydrolase [Thermaerobacter sp.]|nr:MBL fold metallo-hydrolase [Thermaerobacter sp.]